MNVNCRSQTGFTLIEGIITIVILGIAMVTLTSFLFPQAERSAIPHYQARAAAIGHAFLNEILPRKFDHRSDPLGDSVFRCNEEVVVGVLASPNPCTPANQLGPEGAESTSIQLADDVDDFIGCWGDKALCQGNTFDYRGTIESIIGSGEGNYKNIFVEVTVQYDSSAESVSNGITTITLNDDASATVTTQKQITVHVRTTRYGDYEFVAYRGNY